MWKHVRARAVRVITEERDIMGLGLSLESHPSSMSILVVWRAEI